MISNTLNIKTLTSWELIDLMLYFLDKRYLDRAEIVQNEILSRTYYTEPSLN